MENLTKVILADANEEFRILLEDTIEKTGEFSVVGSTGNGAELVELVQGDPKHPPALLENLSRIFDECMGDYARPITIEVNFMEVGDEN